MKLSLIIISIFIFGCNQTKREKNSLEELNLKGPVKTVIFLEYGAEDKFGEIVKKQIREKTIICFNKSGYVTSNSIFNNCNIIKNKIYYQYNSKGKILNEIMYDSIGNINQHMKFKHNDKGYLIEIVNLKQTFDNINKKTIAYNKQGYKLEENCFDKQNKLIYKYIFKYKDNKIVSSAQYDNNGKLIVLTKHMYHSNGNLIEIIEKNNFGKIENKETFKYDEYDNITKLTNIWVGYQKLIDKNIYSNFDYENNWTKMTNTRISTSSGQSEAFKTIIERKLNYY